MSCNKTFICDVCGKPIEEGRERDFMATVRITGTVYRFDDGSDDWEREYHVHNDRLDPTECCCTKLFSVLNAARE